MFGDSPELARELAELVASGPKRATASLPVAWTASGESLPRAGDTYIVHDWDGTPYALIENSSVEIVPFEKVDARFAYDEGEGDRSLESWREAHWSYFSRECARHGLKPRADMLVICQRFRVLFGAGLLRSSYPAPRYKSHP